VRVRKEDGGHVVKVERAHPTDFWSELV
jgi:hypothetical protein